MSTIPHLTKSNLWLKSLNLKCLTIVLVLIPSVSSNKIIVNIVESLLACAIREVKSLQIIHKNVFSKVIYSCNISTLINTFTRKIILRSCVCNNFFSSCSIFCSYCPVMIAFNPKMEIALSDHHFVICLFIIFKFL